MEAVISAIFPVAIVLLVLYRIVSSFKDNQRRRDHPPPVREADEAFSRTGEREQMQAELERRAQGIRQRVQEARRRAEVSQTSWEQPIWEPEPIPDAFAPVLESLREEPAQTETRSAAPSSEVFPAPPLAPRQERRQQPRIGKTHQRLHLASRQGLRQAILAREILGPPKGLQSLEEGLS